MINITPRWSPGTALSALMFQGVIVLVASVVLLFLPPAAGSMTVIPLPFAQSPLRWLGNSTDWRLLKASPTGRTVIISAQRSEIAPLALRHGAIIIGAPWAGCTPADFKRAI